MTPIETYLLDAQTGILQKEKGELRPLLQQTTRPLQKTGKQTEFWATIPDLQKGETEIGIYNDPKFVIKPLLRVPRIISDSMNLWVDEPAEKVYMVYEGQLLAIPLSAVETGR